MSESVLAFLIFLGRLNRAATGKRQLPGAFVDGMPRQRIEAGSVKATLPGLHDQSVMSQFAQGEVDSFRASPSLGLQDRHGRTQIAVVAAAILPGQVA